MRYAVEQNGMLVWIDTDENEKAKKAGKKPMTKEEFIAEAMRRVKRGAELAKILGIE